MPIEYQIVRCCSCLTFQVQQKKKVNKFSCRLCGTKQSLQRIYGQSYKAADLRPIVQDLNMAEGSTREEERRRKLEESSSEDEELDGYLRGDKTESVKEKVQEGLVNSVWNEFKYEDSESEEEHLDSTDDIPLNFDAHSRFIGNKRANPRRQKEPYTKKRANNYRKSTYVQPKTSIVSKTTSVSPPTIRKSSKTPVTKPISKPIVSKPKSVSTPINTTPKKASSIIPSNISSMWDQYKYDNSSESEDESE